jgi:hypothetical protein
MSRFDNIKNKKPLPRSFDEFVEGANQERGAQKARKRPSKNNLLLIAAGRVASKEIYAKAGLLYLKKDIQADIEKYCTGNKQAILNYLIRRGLDDLIAKGERVIEEAE